MPIYAWWWELQFRHDTNQRIREDADRKPWQRTPEMAEARKRHAERMRERNGASV